MSRPLLFGVAVVAAFAAIPAAAQGPSAAAPAAVARDEAVEQLRALVSDEQRHLDALRGEVARRADSLAAIAAKLDELIAAPSSAAAPLPAPDRADVQAARPESASRFEVYGDSTFRLATTTQDYDGCALCVTRVRGRLRLRFGVEGRLAPGLRVVTGLGMGELNDPNSIYQTLGGNMGRKVTTWDRAYFVYRPPGAPWLDLSAGKMPYPWTRSSMTFDVDLYPEGASERVSFDLKRTGRLENLSAQGLQLIVNEFATETDTTILGSQLAARVNLGAVTMRPSFTFFDIRRPESLLRGQIAGTNVGTRNTNAVEIRDGQAYYASQFRYLNAIIDNTVRTRWEAWPATAAFEYQRNLGAASDRDTGMSVRVEMGRQQRTGDWALGWHLFRVEQDAIISALGESDWRAPSNVVQQRVSIVRTLHPSVWASWTLYRGRTLDTTLPGALLAPGLAPHRRDPWLNQMYFDIIYRY